MNASIRPPLALCALLVAACQQQSEAPAYTAWHTRTTGAEQPSGRVTSARAEPSPPTQPAIALITTVPAMIADERVAADEPLPPAPAEPAIAPALEERARALQALVARTEECWTNPAYARIAHFPPAECEQWFDALARGGDASSVAIGRHLASRERPMGSQPLDRLSAILSADSSHAGLALILRRLHQTALREAPEREPMGQRAMAMDADVGTFEISVGYPVNVGPSWVSPYDASAVGNARESAVRALRFWTRYASASDWRALSEQRLRLWLAADEARVIRATQLILRRSASAALEPQAKESLRRVLRETTRAEPRAIAQSLLGMIESPNRDYR